jgi:hypothetical protein
MKFENYINEEKNLSIDKMLNKAKLDFNKNIEKYKKAYELLLNEIKKKNKTDLFIKYINKFFNVKMNKNGLEKLSKVKIHEGIILEGVDTDKLKELMDTISKVVGFASMTVQVIMGIIYVYNVMQNIIKNKNSDDEYKKYYDYDDEDILESEDLEKELEKKMDSKITNIVVKANKEIIKMSPSKLKLFLYDQFLSIADVIKSLNGEKKFLHLINSTLDTNYSSFDSIISLRNTVIDFSIEDSQTSESFVFRIFNISSSKVKLGMWLLKKSLRLFNNTFPLTYQLYYGILFIIYLSISKFKGDKVK